MKKIIIKYGLLAGLILVSKIMVMLAIKGDSIDFEKGATTGTLFTIGAFSMIFLGIREFRDKLSGGYLVFNRGFRVGILITLIGSSIYMLGWMINFYYIDTGFIENYTSFYSQKIQESGKSPVEIEKELAAFKTSMSSYENPFVMMMYAFLEVFPVGLIVTVLCALLMRRKDAGGAAT